MQGAGTQSGVSRGAPRERPDLYDFAWLEARPPRDEVSDRARGLADIDAVVLDIETTGLDRDGQDRVVSLAGVRVRGCRLLRGQVFDAMVNPGRPIPHASVAFHGLTDLMVAEAPPIGTVLPAFLRFVGDAILVGHKVWFDLHFLRREAGRSGMPAAALEQIALDTQQLARVVDDRLSDLDLEGTAHRLGATTAGRHSALGDALATAEIYVRLIPLLRARGITTVGQALDAVASLRHP